MASEFQQTVQFYLVVVILVLVLVELLLVHKVMSGSSSGDTTEGLREMSVKSDRFFGGAEPPRFYNVGNLGDVVTARNTSGHAAMAAQAAAKAKAASAASAAEGMSGSIDGDALTAAMNGL